MTLAVYVTLERTATAKSVAATQVVEEATRVAVEATSTAEAIIAAWDQAIQVDLEDLFRYIEKYEGKFVIYKGRVVQVMYHEDGDVSLRVSVSGSSLGFGNNIVLLFYRSPEVRILEDDRVEFVGKVRGLHTYEAVLGNEVTLPLLDVVQLRFVED